MSRRLLNQPKIHHAVHLKELRDACESNAVQVLNTYRVAVKQRAASGQTEFAEFAAIKVPVKVASNSTTHASKPALTGSSPTAEAEFATFDNLDEIERANEDSNATTNTSIWTSLGLSSGKADKFKV